MIDILADLTMVVVVISLLALMCRDHLKNKEQEANVRFWGELQEWMDAENPAERSNAQTGPDNTSTR